MPEYVKRTNNPNMGRKKIEVDWEKFELAAKLMATKEEICGHLGVKDLTLTRRIKEKYGTTFEGILKELSSGTKVSLRRHQIDAAKKGNTALLIWLGKQYLGQADNQEIRHEVETGNFKKVMDDVTKDVFKDEDKE